MNNSKSLEKKALNPLEVEQIYAIPAGSLANMRYQKRGPKYFKLGRKVLYFIDDLENWLKQNPVLTMDTLPGSK